MRSLLKVKLPLSGRGRKWNPAAQVSLRRSAQPRPEFRTRLLISRPRRHLQTNGVAPDQCLLLPPGCPSLLSFPGDGTSQSQGRNRMTPPPLLLPPTLQALCADASAGSSPAALHTPPRLRSVLLLKCDTDLELPCLKHSKGFVPCESSPSPLPPQLPSLL